jgi:uncharacterized membrane protein
MVKWKDEHLQNAEDFIASWEQSCGVEVALLFARKSNDYPQASYRGGILFASVMMFFMMPFLGAKPVLMVPAYLVLIFIFTAITSFFPFVQKWFLWPTEIDEEIKESAAAQFLEKGLLGGTHQNFIAIYLSEMERRVWVYVCPSLTQKIPELHHQSMLNSTSQALRQAEHEFLPLALTPWKDALWREFPATEDQKNSIPNVQIT